MAHWATMIFFFFFLEMNTILDHYKRIEIYIVA